MGSAIPISLAVRYEARLVRHGIRRRNLQEVCGGLEGLATLSAQKGDGTEASTLIHLALENLEGNPAVLREVQKEMEEILRNPYRVIDPSKVSYQDTYDPTHSPEYTSSH